MGVAIIELLLSVGVIGGAVVGLAALFVRYTEFGQRWARRIHKFSLDTDMIYECPMGHGLFGPTDVIEIDGVGLCPTCYRDIGTKQRLFRLKKRSTHARWKPGNY